jgi:hypothetical protein
MHSIDFTELQASLIRYESLDYASAGPMRVDNSSAVSATEESMSTANPGVDNFSALSATVESMSTAYPDVPTISVASLDRRTSGVTSIPQPLTKVTSSAKETPETTPFTALESATISVKSSDPVANEAAVGIVTPSAPETTSVMSPDVTSIGTVSTNGKYVECTKVMYSFDLSAR